MTGTSKRSAISFHPIAWAFRNRSATSVARIIASLGCVLALAGRVHAAMDADVTISSQAAGGGVFNYTLTLNNLPDSTDQIETLWFSWTPGLDFMSSGPLSISSPTGWLGSSQHTTSIYFNDGYSVQYYTTTAPLNPGGSLQFDFSSLVTPTEIAGNDSVYGYYPEVTTFLYSVSIESGDGEQVLAQMVPEPSSFALAALGITAAFGLMITRRKFRP
jgi:PEP-CTERM motif